MPAPCRGRQGRRRHQRARHRAREREGARSRMSLALAPFEWTATDGNTYKVNLLDTPGYASTSPARSTRRCRSPTSPCSSSAPSKASSRRPRCCGACRRAWGCRGWCSSARRTRTAPTSTRVLEQLRGSVRSAASLRSNCPSARRLRCTASSTCCREEALDYDARRRAPHRAAAGRRGRRGARTARRARRGDRLRATTSSSSATCRATCPASPSSSARSRTRCSTAPSSRCCSVRPPPASASTASPTASASSARRPPIAPPPSTAGDSTVDVPADPAAKPLALRVQDHRRPVHRPALGVQGGVAAPSRPTTNWSTAHRRRGAAARPVPAAGQGADPRHRGGRRRHRRGRQAHQHAHRRHARRQGLAGEGGRRAAPGAAVRRGHRAPHPGRRRQARQRAGPHAGRGPVAATSTGWRRPVRRCCAASATPTSRSPSTAWPASSA